MPVFPSLMRRMQESSPAMTLFQGGITPRPYEIAQDPPPVRSSADGVREQIAQQLRYEDIAPKLEPIPETPAFKPKDKYGFVDRLKMTLGGAGLGAQRGGGLGALGGIIAGLVNPEAIDRHGYAAYVRPQYDAHTQAVQGRNKQRLEAFKRELEGREAVSKINERTQPKYRQATSSQYTLIFDERTGEFVPAMDQGEPVEAASVVVGRGHDTTRKMVEKQKAKDAWARLMETLESREGIAALDRETRKAIADAIQRGQMQRLRITEGGKWGRQKQKLEAEGYETSGTGASTGSARPGGGAGNEETIRKLKEQLKKSNKGLGILGPDDEDLEDWY